MWVGARAVVERERRTGNGGLLVEDFRQEEVLTRLSIDGYIAEEDALRMKRLV